LRSAATNCSSHDSEDSSWSELSMASTEAVNAKESSLINESTKPVLLPSRVSSILFNDSPAVTALQKRHDFIEPSPKKKKMVNQNKISNSKCKIKMVTFLPLHNKGSIWLYNYELNRYIRKQAPESESCHPILCFLESPKEK